MKLVSVVVPCYNEQEVLPMFYDEITRVTAQMSHDFPELSFEYLFINDGSKDNTLPILRSLADRDKRVRYISFSRNFGKESGMYAGLKNAKGDYVVVMDADLQHPPAFLPQMYSYVRTGEYDCATTRRVSRDGESKVRSWFARLFYKIMNKISQTEIVDGAQDFHNLLSPDAERAHGALFTDILEAVLIQKGPDIAVHALVVDGAELRFRRIGGKDIFRDAGGVEDGQLLVDNADAGLFRCDGAWKVHAFSVQKNFASVRLVDAGQDVHQRAFARAVFAEQRMHLSALKLEIHAIQRLDARKLLCNVLQLQYIFAQSTFLPC